MTRKKILIICLTALLAACFCGAGPAFSSNEHNFIFVTPTPDSGASSDASVTDSEYYQAPDFKDAVFHADLAYGTDCAWIDTSAVSDGYVAAAAVCPERLKFQIRFGDLVYNFNLPGDGTAAIFPLVFGNGDYTFRIMRNVTENRYAEEYSLVQNVTLTDRFQPYLRPNVYVPYTAEYNCVAKAKELTATCRSQVEVIEAVYNFIIANVTYDYEKAASVQSGYVPNPDETMATGKGICFDYAALAGAMLRSLGIPTREVHGYVAPNDLYHAWNMFYTEETGWVTVTFTATPEGWFRMDATFGAAGQADSFIGDGTNYTDVYYY